MELYSLAAESDIVIVTASLSPSTRHIVSKEFLAQMRSSSFLVNVARGGLVDQDALLDSLQSGGNKGKYKFSRNITENLVKLSVVGGRGRKM